MKRNSKKSKKIKQGNILVPDIVPEQKIGDEVNSPQIRHVEQPINLPFLNEIQRGNEGERGAAEDLKETWGLTSAEAKVTPKRKNYLIGLAVASVVLTLLITGIFVILPKVLPGFFQNSNLELFVKKPVKLMYKDSSYRVVNSPVVTVYSAADIKSDRVSNILYNEVVTLLSEDNNGFVKIKTQDGIEGFIDGSKLMEDMSSVEPDLHEYKLVVSDISKNVMTHASNGTLITKVMMNTVLYADVKRDGVYQVYLPGGDMGWIGSSGVIELNVRGKLQELSSRYFVSSVLTFVNATYMSNGCSMDGVSVNGAVYVASSINGVEMPRTMKEQAATGKEVKLNYDAVTGEITLDSIIPGDLVFLSKKEGGSEIYEMGVCTDTGSLFMISKAKTTCRLQKFESGDSICHRIVTVRRIFEAD